MTAPIQLHDQQQRPTQVPTQVQQPHQQPSPTRAQVLPQQLQQPQPQPQQLQTQQSQLQPLQLQSQPQPQPQPQQRQQQQNPLEQPLVEEGSPSTQKRLLQIPEPTNGAPSTQKSASSKKEQFKDFASMAGRAVYHYLWPPGRTWLATLVLLMVFVAMGISQAYSDNRVPIGSVPLVDVGHQWFGSWGITHTAPDNLMITTVVLSVAYGVFAYTGPVPKVVIWRRFLWLLAFGYFFRTVCLLVTTMPPTGAPCNLQAARSNSLPRRMLMVLGGDMTCSDLMYSGHTMMCFVCARFMELYAVTPIRGYPFGRTILVWLWWTMACFVLWLSSVSRNHYSSDVVVAALVGWGYTTIYHLCIKIIYERRLAALKLKTLAKELDLERGQVQVRRKKGFRGKGVNMNNTEDGDVPMTPSRARLELLIDDAHNTAETETRGSQSRSASDHTEVHKESSPYVYDVKDVERKAKFNGPHTLLTFIEWIDAT